MEGETMREDLFQFIWRYQYFNHHDLQTSNGESIQVLDPGRQNTNQGPDFLNARIRINGRLYIGPVELHIQAADWYRHGHVADMRYAPVILHVVWEGSGGPKHIPHLILKDRIPKLLLGQYNRWMQNPVFIPCEHQLHIVSETAWAKTKKYWLIERMQKRTDHISIALKTNNQHWEETTWWMMARSFGQPLNGNAFEAIGRSLPLRLIQRLRTDATTLTTLLLGQANLLSPDDPQYRYLRFKYKLQPVIEPLLFHRIRPGNAPAVRLQQLAGLAAAGTGWWTKTREAETRNDLMNALPSTLSMDMKHKLLINAHIPLLYAYGILRQEPQLIQKALNWLQELPPEKNSQMEEWKRIGAAIQNAADSQALLEGRACHCLSRRCLECAAGQELLRPVSRLSYSS